MIEIKKLPAIKMLEEAFAALWREKQVALLLSTLTVVLWFALFWPAFGVFFILLGDVVNQVQRSSEEALALLDEIKYLTYWAIPSLFLSIVVYVIWTRTCILGRGHALDGGVGALMMRSLWVLWRYICLIGWFILLTVVFYGVVTIIILLLGASAGLPSVADGGDIAAMGGIFLLMFPFFFFYYFIMLILTGVFYFSMHCECRDMRMPIWKAWKSLKGNKKKIGALIFAIQFGMSFLAVIPIMFAGATLFMGEITFAIGIFLFFTMLISVLTQFLLITFGAVYANKLVQKLKWQK